MTQAMQHPQQQQQQQPLQQQQQPPQQQQQQQPTQPQQDMINSNGVVVGLGPAVNGVNVNSASNSPLNGVVVSLSNDPSASSKEKTPMCLINELARYNKVCIDYCYYYYYYYY